MPPKKEPLEIRCPDCKIQFRLWIPAAYLTLWEGDKGERINCIRCETVFKIRKTEDGIKVFKMQKTKEEQKEQEREDEEKKKITAKTKEEVDDSAGLITFDEEEEDAEVAAKREEEERERKEREERRRKEREEEEERDRKEREEYERREKEREERRRKEREEEERRRKEDEEEERRNKASKRKPKKRKVIIEEYDDDEDEDFDDYDDDEDDNDDDEVVVVKSKKKAKKKSGKKTGDEPLIDIDEDEEIDDIEEVEEIEEIEPDIIEEIEEEEEILEAEAIELEGKSTMGLTQHGEKILVVDDNRLSLSVAENSLADLNIELITASSGEEAIDIINSRHIDLVATDLHLASPDNPSRGMNGEALLRIVSERRFGTPAIVITGKDLIEEIEMDPKWIPLNVKGFVQKGNPFWSEELKDKIKEIINKPA